VAEASDEYLAANLSAIKVRITYFPGLNVISGVGFAITFLVGGLWVLGRPVFGLTGALTPGAFVTFVIYAQQFLWPIIRLGDVVDDYERAKAAGSRVQDVLSRDPTVRDRPDARSLEVDEGAVTYDDVQFAYAGETVLTDVDFAVEGGTTVGVVGPTGAGKSTLLKLLPRLYDVDNGAVRIDGHDVRDVTLRSLRRSIGYVSQEPFLFFGTVRENIRYGTFDATDNDIERAARRAQAHEFIENLPDGYETLVGERGVKLSGGQRQRLALARTMLKDPAILVLDEATSAVDTETEALIQDRLAEFAADRTTFVIAHRLSTVRTADRILVLDDGQVVEDGTHEGLLERDGLYANFWRVQTGDIASLPESSLNARSGVRQLSISTTKGTKSGRADPFQLTGSFRNVWMIHLITNACCACSPLTTDPLFWRPTSGRATFRTSLSTVPRLRSPWNRLGFLGPNGTGKTTTMRLLTGLSNPDSGAIRVCVVDVDDRRAIAAHVGYLLRHHHCLTSSVPASSWIISWSVSSPLRENSFPTTPC